MNQTFKFRYANELAGGLVLLSIVLLAVAVFFAGRAQKWFAPRIEVYTNFPNEGTFGIKVGADCIILGAQAGKVREILVDDDGGMTARMVLGGEFARYVRQDSVALIKRKYSVAGDAFFDITRGTGPPLEGDRPAIECRKDTELVELVTDMVNEIRAELLPVLDDFQSTIIEYREVAANLRDPDSALQQFLTRLDHLAQELEQGEGTLGKLLRDPQLASEVEEALRRANRVAANLEEVSLHLSQAAERLPSIAGQVDDRMGEVADLARQAESSLVEAEVLLQGLQRHWLLRRSMEPDATGDSLDVLDVPLGVSP